MSPLYTLILLSAFVILGAESYSEAITATGGYNVIQPVKVGSMIKIELWCRIPSSDCIQVKLMQNDVELASSTDHLTPLKYTVDKVTCDTERTFRCTCVGGGFEKVIKIPQIAGCEKK